MSEINMIRIASKLDELFKSKIDLSDYTKSNIESTFYSRALASLAIIMECGVDDSIACKSITDGYHDIGIDAIYCDDIQKKLVLVQSKWRSDGTGSISQQEILTFIQGIKRVITLDFDGVNDRIKSKIPEIRTAIKDMDYQIVCIFCHTGNQSIPDFCQRPVNDLLSVTNDDTNEILRFCETRQSNIFSYLASGQDADNICIDDVILNNWGFLDEPYKAFYGTISAAALGEWFSKFGNRLFAKNIRFYKGDTDVNYGMKKVLLEEPEHFFYYNNGVKMLCKKIVRKAAYSTTTNTGLFSLEGVSLVNGAQTTGTIGTTFDQNPDQVRKAVVAIQLIDLDDAPETYKLQITKLSNTQNRIDNKEFAALDPEQERIKTELRFSDIFYLYKSGATVDDPTRQISLDEAIIAQACLQEDVTYAATAKRNVGALTEDIGRPPYKVLFNANTSAFGLKNSVDVLRTVEQYLQNHEEHYQGRNRLALVHGNRFILYLILQQLKKTPNYYTQIFSITDINSIVDTMCTKYIPKVIDAMNTEFADAYPAHIFKNVGRCRRLIENINSTEASNK